MTEDKEKYLQSFRSGQIYKVPVSILVDYCEEKENYDLLDHVSDTQLFTEVKDGKNLMQYMIDKKKEGKDGETQG